MTSKLIAALGALAIVTFASIALATVRPGKPAYNATDLTGVAWGRDFHLLGDDGKSRELADFRGKVVALYFGYTRCPDVCPITMATLGQAVRLLGEDARRVQVLFVTVDPKHDTPKALAKYVRSFDEGFLGLYGDSAALARTTGEFKVEAGEHHSIPVFLFDPSGRLRLVVKPQAAADSIAHDMRLLLAAASG